MITDPDVVRVLCFGDSNTFGAAANGDGSRVPPDRRWTGVLQTLLGDRYEVIEEGLNGRTTDLDYDDRPGCNGRSYFRPCLLSHRPVDAVVIMMGTNDLKSCFDRTPTAIADALGGYLDDIDEVTAGANAQPAWVPTTVLVGPIWVDDAAPLFDEVTEGSIDGVGAARSRELGVEIRRVAHERNATYADAAQVARAGEDGLHLSPDSHARLAELVAPLVTRDV